MKTQENIKAWLLIFLWLIFILILAYLTSILSDHQKNKEYCDVLWENLNVALSDNLQCQYKLNYTEKEIESLNTELNNYRIYKEGR